jgi:tetratricopeptide (TPR) repeat protein
LDEAIAAYSRAIELAPKYGRAWTNRGIAYFKRRQYDQAVADFSRAIELDRRQVLAWSYRGIIYCDHLGQPARAVADFSAAIELSPTSATHWCNRGIAYRTLGQYETAIPDFSRALALSPKYTPAWYNRGLAHHNLGRYDGAVTDYQTALKLAPAHAGAHNSLAWLLATCPDAKRRDPARAVALAKKAVGLAPDNRYCWGTLGAAHYRAGDWKAAVAALDRTRALQKDTDGCTCLLLAMTHRKLGHDGESRRWYDRAVQRLARNKEALAKDRVSADEHRRFLAEAEEVLGLKKK